MIAAHIIQMLQLQDAMNKVVNPDWTKADYPWHKAVYVECAELLDHLGWKWWKHQEPNLQQAHIELVDIWHFLLSYALETNDGDIQAATRELLEGWSAEGRPLIMHVQDDGGSEKPEPMEPHDKIMLLPVIMGVGVEPTASLFRSICEDCALPDHILTRLYSQKNILNLFRQRNGYKDGTYIKIWNGLEDNEVLGRLIDESGFADHVTLTAKLTEAYGAAAK